MKIAPREKGETQQRERKMRDYRQSLLSLRENEGLPVVYLERD